MDFSLNVSLRFTSDFVKEVPVRDTEEIPFGISSKNSPIGFPETSEEISLRAAGAIDARTPRKIPAKEFMKRFLENYSK